MREYVENGIYVQEFESLEDVIEYSKRNCLESNSKMKREITSYEGGTHWFGPENHSVEDVKRHTEYKWNWGLNKISDLELIKSIGVLHRKRVRNRGDFGNEVDIHRVYSGDISRAWSTTPKVEAKRTRPISVAVPLGGNANVDAETLFWRAAGGIKLVEALNYHNIPTRMYGFHVTHRAFDSEDNKYIINGENVQNKLKQIFLIKDHQHPFNVSDAIKICAMAGFFRYYTFLAHLNNPYFKTDLGLGRCMNTEDLPLFNGDKVFITPTNLSTKEEAETWLKKILNKVLVDERVEDMV